MASVLDLVKHYQHAIEKYPNDEQKILKCIDKLFNLGVTVQHLQETGVGRTVNALRKDPGDIGQAARALVYKWKLMVAAEESDQEGDHDTSNYNGNGRDTDDSQTRSKYEQPSPQNSYQKNHEHTNGNHSGTKRNHHSSEEDEPDRKRSKHTNSSESDKHKRSYAQVKSEDSENETEDQDSDNSETEESESEMSESSIEETKVHRKIKTEPIDKDRSSKHTSHNNQANEVHKKESSSSKKSHESSKTSSDHSSQSKHSSNKHSSREKSHISSDKSSKSKSHSTREKSSDKEKSAEKKYKSEHKSSEKEKSHKNDSNSSSKHHSSSQKHKSSSHKVDSGSEKHKNHSEKHKSDKHNSHSIKEEKDKHKNSSEEKDKHKNSSEEKDKHKNSSEEKEKHKNSSEDKGKHKNSSEEKGKHNSSSENEVSTEKSKSKSSSCSSKEKQSSSKDKESKNKSKESSSKDSNKSEKKKSSSEGKLKSTDKKSEKSDQRSENKNKHKSDTSSSHKNSKSSSDKSKSKANDEIPKKKNISADEESDDGIDCGSGASFAEALGMVSPAKPKKKSAALKNNVSPNNNFNGLSPAALLSSSAKLAPLPAIEISALPEISPNYKPRPPPKLLPHFSEEEAISAGISSKNQRTKVYSGNKVMGKLPTLFEMCVQVLQEHIDALEYTGGVPYEILKPVVDKATPQQLFMLEHFNAYLMDDTDHLWQAFCNKHFRNKHRQEMETWREMYMRCQEEQEYRLKSLTENIKIAQEAKRAPIKQTKMAYVDTIVKPPRNIARKQALHGTAHSASASPAARVASLAAAPNVLKGSVRPSPSAPVSSSTFNKPKKAPLMQKALQFMRGRKR